MTDFGIKVCSHKRSGTHLLCATLEKNFSLGDASLSVSIPAGKKFILGGKVYNPGERVSIPWGKLWGTHNFFNIRWHGENKDKILYIVRHPVDTIMSYWRFVGPGSEKDISFYISEERVRFWYRHVTGYIKNCLWIHFEDIVGPRHDYFLDKIREHFNLEKKHKNYHRVQDTIGWYSDSKQEYGEISEELISDCNIVLPENFLGYNFLKPYGKRQNA